MNNRIMAMLFALVAAMFISIVPVKAEAAADHTCVDTKDNNYYCDYDDCDEHVHHADQEIAEVPATCTVDGTKRYFVCNKCGNKSEYKNFRRDATDADLVIEAGHSKVDVAEDPATCTETGVEAHVECANCAAWWDLEGNQVNANDLVIPATGHKAIEKQYRTDETHHTLLCDVCGNAANNKAEHTFNSYVNKGEEGHEGTCTVCKETILFEHSTGTDCVCDFCDYAEMHELVLVPANAPTCGADGNVEYYDCVRDGCNRCFADEEGKIELETITDAKLGHDLSVPASDETNHWLACSREGCTARGYQAAHTTKAVDNGDGTHGFVCFAVMGDEEIACTHEFTYTEAHDYSGTSPVKNDDGTHTYTCKTFGCGYEDVQECEDTYGTLDCLCDHCGSVVHHLKFVPAVAATCREDGNVAYYECQRSGCGLRFTDEAATTGINASECVIDATGHNHNKVEFDEDEHWLVCTNPGCGDVKDNSEEAHELVYTRVDGKTHTVTCSGEGCEYKVENVAHDDGGKINCVCKDCEGDMDHVASAWKLYPSDKTMHFKQCTVCYKTLERVAHDWKEPVANNPGYTHTIECATCGTVEEYYCTSVAEGENCTCSVCGEVKLHNIADLHTKAAQAPTCDEAGWEQYYTCDDCDNCFDINGKPIAKPVIAKLEHNYLNKGLTTVEVMGKDVEMHAMQCEYCGRIRTFYHNDSTGDCLCDIDGCDKLAHSHTPIEVQEKEATCLSTGHQGYWKYACGKMFSDAACTQPLEAVVVYPVTEHDWSIWEAEDGVHVRECTFCGETESGEHADQWGDRRCDVCEVELELEPMEGRAATCEEAGWEPYWQSSYTGYKYADEDGNVRISEPVAIPALGHKLTGWIDSEDGETHYQECQRTGCDLHETAEHSGENGCYCEVCAGYYEGHQLYEEEMVPATCEKPGTQAYYVCACKQKYDLDYNKITAPKAIAQLKHDMDPTVKEDAKEGKHYIQCKDCDYKLYENHGMELSDPNKGNYHQWLCECGELEIETHYDKNGDKKCDVCGHSMNSTTETTTVEQHDNKTVHTGQSGSVNATKDWWWNWQEWFTPSNAGGSSATDTEKNVGNNTTTNGTANNGTSGNGAANNGTTGNGTANNGSSNNNGAANNGTSGNGAANNAPTVNAPTASQTSVIAQFINWFLGLFGF